MGDRRSKEDYVHQISTSIYVTNFPEQFFFRDLWKKCQEYGRVIDVYIPNRRTKSGDRFGFVRFIHIKDVDRLVKNLCTLWMGRLRLHANVVRFQRPPLNKAQHVKGANVGQMSFGVSSNSNVFSVSQSSYAGAVKNNGEHKQVTEMDSKPSLVIDESWGFERFNLKYLGGFEVLIELCTKKLLEKFKSHVGVGSWFSSLDIKGKVFWIRAKEVSGWILDFLDEDEEDEEEEPKHDNKSNFEEGEIQSEDPFHIYDMLVKKPTNDNKEEESSKATLKYPPGFTPDDVLRTKDVQDVDDVVEVQKNTQKSNKQDNFTKDYNFRGVTHSKEEDKESFCSGQFRRSVGPQTGNSGGILCAWDPRMFHKYNATISDYFVAIQGEWMANAKKYLVISVYAPQEASEKRMLWSYLNHMIDRWDGESILTGDFNEVRHKEERFGSIFNHHNAMVFNSFISSSGLLEVPLGGCAFTWCHKFIVDTWSNMSITDTNAISKFMKKLRHLKLQTRLWVRDTKESATTKKARLKGNWIEDPNSVKSEFFSHFKERFKSPCSSRLMLEGEFPNKLSADQSIDLECNVGNGLNTKFWEDVWMGNKNSKTSFPRIYKLESDKNHTVAGKMAHNDTAFSLRRQPRDGVEMEQFRALSIVIEGVLLHDMVDR
nr:RNA-directed DNA polymerase, eukaryota, nucleotide-binding alpha-beta plait domain protein [Tanacetum cinerariifolium]